MNSIVKVEWIDSGMHIDHGWANLAKYTEDIGEARTTVMTVGLLMHEDDDVILVGLTYDPSHDMWFGAQMILKSNIKNVEYL